VVRLLAVPYPNQRGLWTNVRSPLEWDVFAVNTYLTVSSIFFLVGLIPDIAAQRDRTKNPLIKTVLHLASFGWAAPTTSGSTTTAPTCSSPHGDAAGVLGAQRRVVGLRDGAAARLALDPVRALLRGRRDLLGVALVINLLIVIRKAYKLEHIVTLEHMEKLAKLVLMTSCMVGYSYLTEFFMAWYGINKYERDVFVFRATGHYWWAFWIMFSCNVVFRCCCGPRRSGGTWSRCSSCASS